MSTKIYNGYKFKDAPSLVELQRISIDIRDRVEPIARNLYYSTFIKEMVTAYDNNQYGFWNEHFYYIAHMKDLYYGIDRYFMERIRHMNVKQERDPDFDFSFSFTTIPLRSREEVLLLLYTERKELREAFEQTPEIEDYYYQNQSDRPKSIEERDWDQRRRDWDEALGGDGWSTPASVGFTYNPYSADRFNFIGLTDQERVRLNNLIPSLETRAKHISLLIMGDEWDTEHPILPLPKNATKEEKDKKYEERMSSYWKFREFVNSDEGKKIRKKKNSKLMKELRPFTYKELVEAKLVLHDKFTNAKERKPYWLDK